MSHRETFQKSLFAKGWNDFVDSAQFREAANAAMLQFHDQIFEHKDMASAAASEWRRQGARQFLEILVNLNINPQKKTPPTGPQLDYQA